jgi:hypothetical protein
MLMCAINTKLSLDKILFFEKELVQNLMLRCSLNSLVWEKFWVVLLAKKENPSNAY